MAKHISDKDIKTLRDARKVLKKISRKIQRYETLRFELDVVDPHRRDAANGKKWKEISTNLYELLDEIFVKGHVDQESDGQLFISY